MLHIACPQTDPYKVEDINILYIYIYMYSFWFY